MQVKRRKYYWGILLATLSLLTVVFVLYDSTPVGYILPIPFAIENQSYWEYKVIEGSTTVIRTAIGDRIGIYEPVMSGTLVSEMMIKQSSELPQSATLVDSIEYALRADGYSISDFSNPNEDLGYIEELLEKDQTTIWLTLRSYKESTKGMEEIIAQMNVFTLDDAYYTVIWQYEISLMERTISVKRVPFPYTLKATSTIPQPESSVQCKYLGHFIGISHSHLEKFECDNVRIAYSLMPTDELASLKKEFDVPVYVLPECSIGSLWQQFACRYLGQSKYDENGNLKPEARAELGI